MRPSSDVSRVDVRLRSAAGVSFPTGEADIAAPRPYGAAAAPPLYASAYEWSRTVNDAGREAVGCLRRHQRCHQGRRRWTRAMNCCTA